MSTGPKTAEGKARSARNAVKHGFSGRTLIVAGDEQQEYAEFIAEWEADLDPFGAPEKELFGQIVTAAWTLRRLSRAEAELLDESLDAPDPLTVDAVQNKLRLYSLYQQRAERTFHKALTALRAIQEERLFRSEVFLKGCTAPVLARTSRIRREIASDKRTQNQANDAAIHSFIFAPIARRQTNSPASSSSAAASQAA